jgi:hypothetical protein
MITATKVTNQKAEEDSIAVTKVTEEDGVTATKVTNQN